MGTNTFVVAGLGNPGSQYEQTRHNVGFIFADWLGSRYGATFSADKHRALSATIRVEMARVYLLKPQTFMNRSGQAVAGIVRYFDVDPSHLLVVHDDIDMHPGRIKLVKGGGAGGHNGIRSIVKELGDSEFFRLKIGVGRPGQGDVDPRMDVDKYVLSNFPAAELEEIRERFDAMEPGLEDFFRGDTARARTRLNAIKQELSSGDQ
jgi:PTH1 family peptidyl-tRNA hydrolase